MCVTHAGVLGQNDSSDVLGSSPLVLDQLDMGRAAGLVLASSWDCWALLLAGCAERPQQRQLVLRHLLPALAAGGPGAAAPAGEPSQQQVGGWLESFLGPRS
jgi:hypothetical protein